MPPRGSVWGDWGLLFITVATCNTHSTPVCRCVVLFGLLLLFPKLSVPTVLILQVICRCRNGPAPCWHLFVHTFAARDGCRHVHKSAKRRGARTPLSGKRLSFFTHFCVPAAERSGGIGSISGAASILSVPREIRHEIKAPIKGQGQHCHLIQYYLYSREGAVMSPSH